VGAAECAAGGGAEVAADGAVGFAVDGAADCAPDGLAVGAADEEAGTTAGAVPPADLARSAWAAPSISRNCMVRQLERISVWEHC